MARPQWLRSRASDFRLRRPDFESCAMVLNPWVIFFTLHCSRLLRCNKEYLTIDSGGYVYEQSSRINCSIWLAASQRGWDGFWLNRCAWEVKCTVQSSGLVIWLGIIHASITVNVHLEITKLKMLCGGHSYLYSIVGLLMCFSIYVMHSSTPNIQLCS